jgi:hypothetical protein
MPDIIKSEEQHEHSMQNYQNDMVDDFAKDIVHHTLKKKLYFHRGI